MFEYLILGLVMYFFFGSIFYFLIRTKDSFNMLVYSICVLVWPFVLIAELYDKYC